MLAAPSQSLQDHVSGDLFCISLTAGQMQVLAQLLVWRMAYQVLTQLLALPLAVLDQGDADGMLGITKNVVLVGLIGLKQILQDHLVHHHPYLPHVLA